MIKLSRGVILLFFILSAPFVTQAVDISDAEKIDINSASTEDLVKIIHIGDVRATELISLRPFSSLDDLVRINGIGRTRVEDIKKEGLAWVLIEEARTEQKPESINYPSGIIINEILPSPKGSDAEEEWIEIFNQGNSEAELAGWKIADSTGTVKTYTFPQGTVIPSQGFLLLSRPLTKITLNNSGDSLKLSNPREEIVDSVEYEKAPRGESFNLTEIGWVWSVVLTPSSVNIIPAFEKERSEEKSEKIVQDKNYAKEEEKGLAAISRPFQEVQTDKETKPLSLSIIALVLAFFSAILILTLKRKTKRL